MATLKQLKRNHARLKKLAGKLKDELDYIDELLKSVGFPLGLESAKTVAQQLLKTDFTSESE